MTSVSKEKMKWIHSLKVGDVVCDCRYRHMKIKAIEEEWEVSRSVINFTRNLPAFLERWIFGVARFTGMVEMWDKQLELEDGNFCSALYCCDVADHDQKVHFAEDPTDGSLAT